MDKSMLDYCEVSMRAVHGQILDPCRMRLIDDLLDKIMVSP